MRLINYFAVFFSNISQHRILIDRDYLLLKILDIFPDILGRRTSQYIFKDGIKS